MRALILAALSALVMTAYAYAAPIPPTYTISEDFGGRLDEYEHKYNRWSREGAKVILDGICGSACTVVLSTKYNLDVCATDRAEVLFHMPFMLDKHMKLVDTPYNRALAMVIWHDHFLRVLPPKMAAVLEKKKIPSVYEGAEYNEMIGWKAPDLFKHVKPCN